MKKRNLIIFAISLLLGIGIGYFNNDSNFINVQNNGIYLIETDVSSLSGFFVSSDGNKEYIVTCYHGLADANSIMIDDKNASLLDYDIYNDIALLSIDKTNDFKFSYSDCEIEDAVVIGYPNKKKKEIKVSIIDIDSIIENSIQVNNETIDYSEEVIVLDNVLENGYSGSPLINNEGKITGMVTMADDSNTYAVDIDTINEFIKKVLTND